MFECMSIKLNNATNLISETDIRMFTMRVGLHCGRTVCINTTLAVLFSLRDYSLDWVLFCHFQCEPVNFWYVVGPQHSLEAGS